MASCAVCNNTIIFGGKRHGALRFCNAACEKKGVLAVAANKLPDKEVSIVLAQVHQGRCPRCRGSGPVDVHTSYRVWSAIALTRWSNRPVVSCRPCGIKTVLGDTLFSAALGWWGFPWGLLITPVQIFRNVVSIVRAPDPMRPSASLERIVRLRMVAQAAADAPSALLRTTASGQSAQ